MRRKLKDLTINLGLLAGSFLLSFLLVETVFRSFTWLEDRSISHTRLDQGEIAVPEDGVAKLGHIIRRVANPRLIYELKPYLEVVYEGAAVKTNSLGMRSPEVRDGPVAATVVGIGDSFMFGQGVDEGEPYLAALEQRFAAAGRAVRILNLAVPGYNTVMEVESLKTKGLRHDPDLVILEFVGNDLSLPNFVHGRRDVLDLERSFAVDYFRHRLRWNWNKSYWKEVTLAGMQDIPMEDPQGLGRTIDPSRVPPEFRHLVGWQAYRGAMDELLALSRSEGFRVLLISLSPEDGPLKQEVRRHAEDHGIEFFDVGPFFRAELERLQAEGYLGSPLALGADDGHPSPLGHRIAGEVLFQYLEAADLP